jgi:hypothetical protein
VTKSHKLPEHTKCFGADDIEEMYTHLRQNHGISKELAKDRLHKIKEHYGYRGDDNVIIHHTGNVYDPVTREYLDSLTLGGAK